MYAGIHANRVAGTRLDAKPAVYAAQRIDLIPRRILFHGIIGIFSRLDINAIRRACCRAEKAGGALHCAVFLEGQSVPATEGRRIRIPLLGILNRDRGLAVLSHAEGMQSVNQEITPKTIAGSHEPAQDGRQIYSLPQS